MNLSLYVEDIHRQLLIGAEAGGDDARTLAERLVAPLESAIRLALQDALAAAAEEITCELAPGSVELRLRGRDPAFVVTLRMPDQLKSRVEAAAGTEGLSVNAWLVRAAAGALQRHEPSRPLQPRAPLGAQRYTGWARYPGGRARVPGHTRLFRRGVSPDIRGIRHGQLRHSRADIAERGARRRRRPDRSRRPPRHGRRGASERPEQEVRRERRRADPGGVRGGDAGGQGSPAMGPIRAGGGLAVRRRPDRRPGGFTAHGRGGRAGLRAPRPRASGDRESTRLKSTH